ncbi:ribonuclease Z [Aquipuribacter sp. SD81]|uniref:ribonuclease Z n=1 Tax=Aquipuribacter sp. SD81 TaxID=3127703 RepID=UPI00301A4811
MSVRELVVLGTASQVPTRTRNHNGYLLRWGADGLLFDPGEGTQRQLTQAGVPASAVTRACLTHLHGDHCLGLPGVVQRLGLDGVRRDLPVHYPAAAAPTVTALLASSVHVPLVPVAHRPVDGDGPVARGEGWTLSARALDHRVPTVGYRLEEDDGVRMLPDALAAAGVQGPDVARLQRQGTLEVGGRTVALADVSVPRRGQVAAVVMDTRWCDGAVELARGADLLLCEATYLHRDADLAEGHGHLTARQAGELAAAAGVRRLVLTHFSQRYGDSGEPFRTEAAEVHDDVVAAEDLQRVPLPPRR